MAVATEVRAPAPPPTDAAGDAPADAAPPRAPRPWWRAPFHATAESWVGAVVVFLCMAFVFSQVHPELILARTTPAGGDMGAHVWGPAYLRDHLLPHGRLTGWTPDWYAGFPAYQFYMLPPALLILLLDIVLPYGIAMKLVTVSGIVALPLCAYVMGRLFRLPFPGPPLLAIATLPFLFDKTWTIYGGNVASTLAGEFSFSISLALVLLFFGFLSRGLDEGKHRGLCAVLLALVILSHPIPAFFAIGGGGVMVLLRLDRQRLVFVIPTFAVGTLLTAFWSIPFIMERGYLTDMGWERLTKYQESLLPQATRWIFVLALVGFVLALVFWIRMGVFLGATAVLFALGVVFDIGSPVHIWNARLLPFYYLSLCLLAAVGVSEVVRSLAVIVDSHVEWRRRLAESAGAVGAMAVIMVLVALPLRTLPGGELGTDGIYRWGPIESADTSFVGSWAKWNYTGYERKDTYAEYHAIVQTMADLGETNGCGRAHWEYGSDLNRYGTPMAMMLLPFWTDGCIGSMEGLYFESSGTTPFHFLNSSELSKAPSNPVRDEPDRPMPYHGLDVAQGVRHLQLMGVKYYLAFSPEVIEQADRNPDLTPVAESAPWKVYEVADSEIVEPLSFEPAVVEGLSTENPAWQREAVAWYMDLEGLDVVLGPDGPDDWQRIEEGETPEKRELPEVEVSNVHEGDLSVTFDVDRVGVPILVKTSYFPNWGVSGADGPYHVTPNLMVVVPTSKHVELEYGYTKTDLAGYGLSAIALIGVLLLARRGQVALPERRRRAVEGEGPSDGPPPPPEGDGWDPAPYAPKPAPEAEDPDAGSEPAKAPVGFWDSLLAERKAEEATRPVPVPPAPPTAPPASHAPPPPPAPPASDV